MRSVGHYKDAFVIVSLYFVRREDGLRMSSSNRSAAWRQPMFRDNYSCTHQLTLNSSFLR